MAFAPLATAADLSARGVDIVSDPARIAAVLASASEAVRDAAGVPISRVTATMELPVPDRGWLRLPGPVTAVASVTQDGSPVEYVRQGDELWSEQWIRCADSRPENVTVVATFGYDPVPADIVELVCSVARLGLSEIEDGPLDPRKQSQSVDDWAEAYVVGQDATVSWSELPIRTREMLRARFGTTAVVIGVR